MNVTSNNSQSRNAAKVAGFASAITLIGVAAVKAKHFVTRKRSARRATPAPPVVVE